MFLRILNLEEHQNCIIGKKVTTNLTMFFRPWLIRAFLDRTSLQWIIGDSAEEGLSLLALETGVRWNMTCDMVHLTCDMWLVTWDTWFFLNKKCQKKSQKVPKMQINGKNTRFLLFRLNSDIMFSGPKKNLFLLLITLCLI